VLQGSGGRWTALQPGMLSADTATPARRHYMPRISNRYWTPALGGFVEQGKMYPTEASLTRARSSFLP